MEDLKTSVLMIIICDFITILQWKNGPCVDNKVPDEEIFQHQILGFHGLDSMDSGIKPLYCLK